MLARSNDNNSQPGMLVPFPGMRPSFGARGVKDGLLGCQHFCRRVTPCLAAEVLLHPWAMEDAPRHQSAGDVTWQPGHRHTRRSFAAPARG